MQVTHQYRAEDTHSLFCHCALRHDSWLEAISAYRAGKKHAPTALCGVPCRSAANVETTQLFLRRDFPEVADEVRMPKHHLHTTQTQTYCVSQSDGTLADGLTMMTVVIHI